MLTTSKPHHFGRIPGPENSMSGDVSSRHLAAEPGPEGLRETSWGLEEASSTNPASFLVMRAQLLAV